MQRVLTPGIQPPAPAFLSDPNLSLPVDNGSSLCQCAKPNTSESLPAGCEASQELVSLGKLLAGINFYQITASPLLYDNDGATAVSSGSFAPSLSTP